MPPKPPTKAIVLQMPKRGTNDFQPTDPKGPTAAEMRKSMGISLEVIGLPIKVAGRRIGASINVAVRRYVEYSLEQREAAYRKGFEDGRKSTRPALLARKVAA